LHNIKNDLSISQNVRDIAQNLIKSSKSDIKNVNSLWEKAIKEKKISPPLAPVLPSSSSSSSSSVLGKRCFYPDMDVPLHANGSVDILEVVKSTWIVSRM
ncbi:hypothetical protein C1645_840286, partial [Glomus cerebriforme]